MDWIEIQDIGDRRLDVYRDLPRANLTPLSQRFIAEGRLLVERLLASSLDVESILCGARHRVHLDVWRDRNVPVYVVPDGLLPELVGFQFHRGLLACGRRPAPLELNQLVAGMERPQMLVVCAQVVDPTNLASVIRNASAFGAVGLLLGPHCADPFSRRVVRVTMGTVLRLPLRVAADLTLDLIQLRQEFGFHCVGTVLDSQATCLTQAQRPERLAILFGHEGHGLEPTTLELCDECVTLPMERGTDSLNLGTATGVFLYHYRHVARRVR